MDIAGESTKIKDLLDKAQDILIVTHERPTHDSIGSALALSLGLIGLGKKVTVACPEPMTVELSNYVGVNKIVTELANKNFVISLDYAEGSIEKVSYNIEGEKFNLVVEPRPGFESFSPDKVSYSYSGTAADLIFTVDTIHLGGLKKLYDADKELYATTPVVNVDRHPNNAQYGQINVVDPSVPATAEIVGVILSGVGVKLTEDVATNLLNALYMSTSNFIHPAVSARTFDLVAATMKAGGKRFGKALPDVEQPRTESIGSPSAPPVAEASSKIPQKPALETKEGSAQVHQGASQTPADWLRPKIFKSSSLL